MPKDKIGIEVDVPAGVWRFTITQEFGVIPFRFELPIRDAKLAFIATLIDEGKRA